ncbi:MAG: DUF1272 domain-containing protein [Rhodospirillaceae bacterium]|nr:DUF1272 domain-containing protein [Rhodospirillaceae bacterium]MBT4486574.1 DUF1272 domain-containing protein [Rhodospirillaceae bacterium]MBT5193344.1 DUF1272 domain-containing protein [Rhodospirillaceae bacterium]MBT5897596.1 DUF1272 domain-containing protein [Rhodospirillaceae bacterium]
MALEMRAECERCQTALPPDSGAALICSYECTFCQSCGDNVRGICPNCGGQLLPRPTRIAAD